MLIFLLTLNKKMFYDDYDARAWVFMLTIIAVLVGMGAFFIWILSRPKENESFSFRRPGELSPGFPVRSLLARPPAIRVPVNWDDRQWRMKWSDPTLTDIHPGMGDGPAKNLPSFADPESCTHACQNLAVEMTAQGDRDPGYVANAYEACAQVCRMNFLWRLKG